MRMSASPEGSATPVSSHSPPAPPLAPASGFWAVRISGIVKHAAFRARPRGTVCRRLVLTRGRGQTRLAGSSRADEERSSRLRLPAAANAAAAHARARVLCGQAVGSLGEAPRSGTAGT